MLKIVDLVVVSVYVVAIFGITVFVRRAKTAEDFSVASRDIPQSILFATLAATFIGPGYCMGLADKAVSNGYVWFLIFSAFAVQMLFVGLFVAPRLQTFQNARTIGGVMGQSYGKLTQIVTGFITVGVLTGFVAVMVKASSGIIFALTGLPVLWAAIISCAIVVGYSTFGGIKADILNDSFQFVVLSIAIPLILIFAIGRDGFELIETGVARLRLEKENLAPLTVCGLVASFFFGEMLIPPYAARAFAAKSPSTARSGFVLAAVFGVAWFLVCTSIGIVAFSSGHTENEGALLFAMKEFLPAGAFALAVVALIAIVISSWDSLLNCASTSIQADILEALKLGGEQTPSIVWLRVLNVLIGVFAILIALNVPSLVDALLYCYSLWAPTIVIPFVLASFRINVHPLSGLLAIVSGGLSAGLWEWLWGVPFGIPSLIIGIAINQIAFWVTHFLFRHQDAPKWLGYAGNQQTKEM